MLTLGISSKGQVRTNSKGGGICDVHRPGAKYHWRPIKKEDQVPGPDGKLKTRFYYWVCRLGPKGRGILRQQKLQFGGVRNQVEGYRSDDSRKKEAEDSTTTGGDYTTEILGMLYCGWN